MSDKWAEVVSRIISRGVKEFAGIGGAVLLSTMITILLSRISETQFLIKVTITDVWGAIAIGFIANYGGAKALDKILTGYSPTDATPAAVDGKADQPAARKVESQAPPGEGRLRVRAPASSEGASTSENQG